MNESEIQNWVENWDKKISRWIHSYGNAYNCDTEQIIWAYKGGVIEDRIFVTGVKPDGPELKLYGLPEPYVGNPLSNELSAVFLTLNPAGPIPTQCKLPTYSDDRLVRKVWFHASYYSIFKDFEKLPKETRKWWNVYLQWAKRILLSSKEILPEQAELTDLSSIVGIDLCPWHSESWGGIKIDPKTASWIKENSIKPAAILSKKTKLPYILAVGRDWYEILQQLGFETVTHITNQSSIKNWPTNKKDGKTNRTFVLMSNSVLGCQIFLTWAPGSNNPPASNFADIQTKCIMLNLLPKIA